MASIYISPGCRRGPLGETPEGSARRCWQKTEKGSKGNLRPRSGRNGLSKDASSLLPGHGEHVPRALRISPPAPALKTARQTRLFCKRSCNIWGGDVTCAPDASEEDTNKADSVPAAAMWHPGLHAGTADASDVGRGPVGMFCCCSSEWSTLATCGHTHLALARRDNFAAGFSFCLSCNGIQYLVHVTYSQQPASQPDY